jgi:ferredoxin-NADP reductase
MSLQTFPLILKETYMITPTVRHFAFVREDASHFQFIPGQFITIHFEQNGKTLRRSYSVASIPARTEAIEFAASYIEGGPGSEFLFHLNIGDTLQASGPFGRLILREDEMPRRYVFVATGTGVTPYRSMLTHLGEQFVRHPHLEVILLLGVRNREELLYGDDFIEFATTYPRFRFIPHYSRPSEASLALFERSGYVQTGFTDLALSPLEDVIYLCGNPNMIDQAFEQLRAIGFDTQRIRREKYISPNTKISVSSE